MRHVILTHGQDEFEFSVPSAKDWNDVADYIISKAKPGEIVTLSGPLGAGKTTFTQTLAHRLGIKKVPQSPTFALMRSYEIPKNKRFKRLLHVDAYRLESPRELLALDLDEELSDQKTLLVIEWPEKINEWLQPKQVISITIATK